MMALKNPVFRWLSSQRMLRFTLICLALVWVGSGILAVNRQLHSSSADFHEFYIVNHQLLIPVEERVHQVPYSYPPFFHVLISLFSWMPLGIASLVWFLFCSTLTVASIAMLHRMANETKEKLPSIFIGIPVAMNIGLILTELVMGNVNLVILFCLVLCFYLYSLKREFSSGVALAAGITLKLLPGIFIVYFLYKLRLRVIAGVLAGSLVFAGLMPLVVFGPANGFKVVKGWTQSLLPLISPEVKLPREQWFEKEDIYRGTNQSLQAVLHRFLRPIPVSFGLFGKDIPARINIASLSPSTVKIIFWILAAGILTGAGYLLRLPAGTGRQTARLLLEFSLVLILMLLLSPITWVMYLVHLTVPYFTLFNFLRWIEYGSRRYRITLGCLVAAFILSILGATEFTQSLAVPFLGMLVTGFAVAYNLRGDYKKLTKSSILVDES